jgi:hypothetical protein
MANIKRSTKELSNEFHLSHQDTLFADKTVIALLGVSKQTLDRNRCAGIGLPYFKFNGRIRYKKKDILKYIADNAITTKSKS